MSEPVLGRNAVIRKDGVDIGYAKGVTAGIDVDLVKEFNIGSDTPAVVEPGNKSFPVSIDKMWIDSTYATDVLNGTKVEIIVLPAGSAAGKPKYTYSNVVLTSWELTVEQDGVVMESVKGEAKSLTIGTL